MARQGRPPVDGDEPARPVDPRTEDNGAPAPRRAVRARSRASSAPSAVASETPVVGIPRPAEFEVRARPASVVAESQVIWAPTTPAPRPVPEPGRLPATRRDEPTGALEVAAAPMIGTPSSPVVAPPAARETPVPRTGSPFIGVPVPVVVPGTPPDPVAPEPVGPPVAGPILPVGPPAPIAPPRRKQRPMAVRLPRRPRVRKVSRVVRSIDAWSVFKVSIVFYLAMYVVFLVAGVLLWNVAYSTGTIDNISSFFESFGWKNFEFNGGEIYHNAWIIGLFVVAGLTGLNVVLATLYNLITDLVGGVRLTVLEEEVGVRAAEIEPAPPLPSTTIARPARRRVTPPPGPDAIG